MTNDREKTKEQLINELAELRKYCEFSKGLSKRTEFLYHTLIENCAVGIWHVHLGGDTLYLNPAMCRMLEIEKIEDIAGRHFTSFFTDGSLEKINREYAKRLKGIASSYEVEIIGIHGKRTNAILSGVPILEDDGQLKNLLASFTDITERKRVENALKENEKKFRILAEESPNMIFINSGGKVVYANRMCEEVMKYSREEFYSAGFDFMELIVPEHKAAIRENLGRHFRGEEIPPYEYAIVTKCGNRIETIITTKLIDYEGRKAILGIVTEITDIKKVERALRESDAKYRDLYDNAPDMYHTLDKNGIITDCNETEARMLGYKKEEIIGRPVADFFSEESRKLFDQDFPYLNYKNNLLNLEREFIRKDGTTFMANLNVFSERDEKGNLLGTKTIARDITELKKIEAELLKAQKLDSVGILAGGIAHDFNNVLTAIIGNINLAKISLRPEDATYARLSEAEKACEGASKLTRQLLTFSKGGRPVKKTISLSGLITDCAELATTGSNVKCEITIAGDVLPVDGDEGQIGQAINNLVINAVQSMPDGGTVRLSAKNVVVERDDSLPLKEGRYVHITVTDHGIGIPKGYLQKVFDPYFTTKQKGSGLGLAITYSIIKNHDGYITLKSNPGLETTFYIYLPVSQKPFIERKSRTENIITGKGRILLMDDEEIIRTTAGEILRHIGYEIEVAVNGEEAIKAFKNSMDSGPGFDAVILDLTIPGGMGGREVVKKLLEINPQVKAIASSGYHNDPIMANFRDYGFTNVIPKPYKVSQLSELIHSVIAG